MTARHRCGDDVRHVWNIERKITPARPGRYAFRAKNEGAYELESHTTEQKIATIQVLPQ